tara:strand:- start:807 stop:1337 length:531 start_codon:yes stop_codon:yes gene_type:complete
VDPFFSKAFTLTVLLACNLGNTAMAFDIPGLDDTILKFGNLSFEFDSEPETTDKTLPSGNRFILYTTRKFTDNGRITTYFQVSEAGDIDDTEKLLTKERQFADALNREEESAMTLTVGGYPAIRLITTTQPGGAEQRTVVQALLVGEHIVKIRIVGSKQDLTDEAILAFCNRLKFS